MRRTSRERSIGHTGTLDPGATGLLPLVFGRATRLAFLFAGAAKSYDATVRLGVATETDDSAGRPLADAVDVRLSDDEIVRALEGFRGTFDQMPPSHSAKKIAGERAYDLARRAEPVALKPVSVTVHRLDWLGRDGDLVRFRVTATAGFYVRSLARDLGARLGCGGHLQALRRTASGAFTIDQALALGEAERLGPDLGGSSPAPVGCAPRHSGRVGHRAWLAASDPRQPARTGALRRTGAAAARRVRIGEDSLAGGRTRGDWTASRRCFASGRRTRLTSDICGLRQRRRLYNGGLVFRLCADLWAIRGGHS